MGSPQAGRVHHGELSSFLLVKPRPGGYRGGLTLAPALRLPGEAAALTATACRHDSVSEPCSYSGVQVHARMHKLGKAAAGQRGGGSESQSIRCGTSFNSGSSAPAPWDLKSLLQVILMRLVQQQSSSEQESSSESDRELGGCRF